MVQRTERDDELIADFLRQAMALGKFEMMGMAGFLAADQAWLPGDRAQVRLVPVTT